MISPRAVCLATCALALLVALPARAQNEYRNLESGRPIRISDAMPTERYALDLDLTTLKVEKLSLGRYRLQYEPRIAFGIFPRTEISLRMPSFYREPSISPRGGIAGVGVGGEYQFLMERLSIPAVAISAEAFIPTGPNALRTSYSVKGLLTRSSPVGRIHLNASYGSFAVRQAPTGGGVLAPPIIDGPCDFVLPETGTPMRAFCGSGGLTQAEAAASTIVTKGHWMAGAGLDKSFGLRSLLVAADVYAERFVGIGRPMEWTAEGGARKQITQFLVIDAAVGRRYTGIATSWFATAGTTLTMPVGL